MRYLIIFFVLFLMGCASTSTINLKSYPAKSENCRIKILTQKPDRNFEEIAILNTRGGQSILKEKVFRAFYLT